MSGVQGLTVNSTRAGQVHIAVHHDCTHTSVELDEDRLVWLEVKVKVMSTKPSMD